MQVSFLLLIIALSCNIQLGLERILSYLEDGSRTVNVIKKKIIYFLISQLLLFQSCVAYQKTSVSLNEAHDRGKVKVSTFIGEDIKCKNINMQDDIYYGLSGKNEIKLSPDQIKAIYLKDIKKSKTQTIILISPIIILGVGKIMHLALGSPL